MYEIIKKLRPYFHSLREIESNVILDMKLPYSWNFEDIVSSYSSIKLLVQDKNEKFVLISIISEFTLEGYNIVFLCANEIINVNREEEEKQNLFKEKLKELENLFKHEKLNKLKELNFNIKNEQVFENRNESLGERTEEVSEGVGITQEKNDRRDKRVRQKQNV